MKNLYPFYGKVVSLFATPSNVFSKKALLTFALMVTFSFSLTAQTTLIVNSKDDNSDVNLNDGKCADIRGNCTLRAAIENANQTPETDEIQFSFRGKSPHIISLTSDLPVITETIILNATTQKDYSWSSPVIGVDGSGVARFGFKLEGQSSGSTIQGFVMGNFNIIDEENILGNGTAIYANGTGSHSIKGNFLGVTPDGSSAFSNMFGVALVNSSGNTIGGLQPGDRNVISGNYIKEGWGIGIFIHGVNSFSNNIQGNFVGTDATGTRAIPNHWGIVTHEGANRTIIGGVGDESRNIISGNIQTGVYVLSPDNTISGNYIGTDATSTRAIPNFWGIVTHEGGNSTLIGGASPESRNIISGNIRTGVYVLSPDNVISGNYIGTDKDGKMLTHFGESGQQGIRLWGEFASNNIIGGLEPGEGNVISGNIYFNAITIGTLSENPISGNKVLGNYIGTDPSGQIAIPNARGISHTAQGTTIANNVISGNHTFGLQLHSSKETEVYNNFIGTKADGVSPLGNGENGIIIVNGSRNNKIGSSSIGKGNTIAFNEGSGVLISYFDNIGSQVTTQPFYNSLWGNQIFGNFGLGIDLNSDGISENDLGDDDEGANFLQNFPEISNGASVIDQVLSLSYKVPSEPVHSAYPLSVDFFKSDGNRQGKTYLVSDVFSELDYNDGNDKNFQVFLPSGVDLVSGDFIVATATDANGNTSEFSAEVQVIGDCTPQTWYVDADNDSYGLDSEETNISSCTKPEGNYVTRAGDCDDSDSAINPDAEDIPDDDIDQNCDGEDAITSVVDIDNDGVADSIDNCPETPNADQLDANANGIGDVCETSSCLGTDTLNLSDCTDGSLIFWTVSNPGNCAVDVRWEIRKGSESGVFVLNAGDSQQFTTSIASKGQTQLILSWNDSNGTAVSMNSNASGTPCKSGAASTSTTRTTSDTFSNEILIIYPNPVEENGFYISFPQSYGGKNFDAAIYDLNSRLIGETNFEVPQDGANLFWAIDTGGWIPGVYILNLNSGSEAYQLSLMKE